MSINYEPVNCAKCAHKTHPLELFPGNICLNCHAAKTAHLTPAELYSTIVETFGGRK